MGKVSSNEPKSYVTIVVAMVTTFGLIIVAVIGFWGNIRGASLPIEATQTAEARHILNAMTAQSNLSAPISSPDQMQVTSVTETSSATPAVSATSINTPSLTPVISNTIFEDNFIDNGNRWFVAAGYPNIVAGKYTHKVSCLSSNPSLYCASYVVAIPFKFPRNFHIEMDTKILDLSPGGKVDIGFQIRKNQNGYYQFHYFTSDRSYQLDFISDKGNQLNIIPATKTDLINNDLETNNRFGVEINDSTLILIVNGQELNRIEDGSLSNAGGAYITIFTSRETNATVQITNISVQEVP
jgi:hypothetical protein